MYITPRIKKVLIKVEAFIWLGWKNSVAWKKVHSESLQKKMKFNFQDFFLFLSILKKKKISSHYLRIGQEILNVSFHCKMLSLRNFGLDMFIFIANGIISIQIYLLIFFKSVLLDCWRTPLFLSLILCKTNNFICNTWCVTRDVWCYRPDILWYRLYESRGDQQ